MLSWIISGSALILAIAAIRALLRGRVPARAVYALWLLAALRLLVPGSMDVGTAVPGPAEIVSRAPVVQLAGKLEGAESISLTPDGNVETKYEGGAERVIIAEHATEGEFDAMSAFLSVKKLLGPAWICGAALTAGAFSLAYLRFSRSLRRDRRRIDAAGAPIPVYVSAAADTPCLFGLFRPAVYLTPEAAREAETARCAVEHELAHYRQLDHIWCVVRAACLALHWYNPLVHLAVRLSRRDCELSCDEATVKRLGEAERANYGRTLIRLTCDSPRGAAVATTMSARPRELKERITMLTKTKRSALALALALLLALTATACSFTGGVEPTPASGQAETPADTPERSPVPTGAVGAGPGTIVALELDGDDKLYDFTAPAGAQALTAELYERIDGEWQPQYTSTYILKTPDGRFSIEVDREYRTLGFAISFSDGQGAASHGEPFGEGVEAAAWGMTAASGTAAAALDQTVPVIMLLPGDEDGAWLYMPEDFLDPDAQVTEGAHCITLRFESDEPWGTPEISDPPDEPKQGADMTGFTTGYDPLETYSSALSDWVHDYAENLVLSLDEDDPASCSSVHLGANTVIASALTEPERVLAYIEIECTPREPGMFAAYFGSLAEPIDGGDEGEYMLSAYITLTHSSEPSGGASGGSWLCSAALTELPELWGYSYSLTWLYQLGGEVDYENYIAQMAAENRDAEYIVSHTDYGQLRQAGDESWLALLEALDDIAVSPDGGGQALRDMYIMMAAIQSDGAYAEWVGEVLQKAREAGEDAFAEALTGFSDADRQVILALSTPLE